MFLPQPLTSLFLCKHSCQLSDNSVTSCPIIANFPLILSVSPKFSHLRRLNTMNSSLTAFPSPLSLLWPQTRFSLEYLQYFPKRVFFPFIFNFLAFVSLFFKKLLHLVVYNQKSHEELLEEYFLNIYPLISITITISGVIWKSQKTKTSSSVESFPGDSDVYPWLRITALVYHSSSPFHYCQISSLNTT